MLPIACTFSNNAVLQQEGVVPEDESKEQYLRDSRKLSKPQK